MVGQALILLVYGLLTNNLINLTSAFFKLYQRIIKHSWGCMQSTDSACKVMIYIIEKLFLYIRAPAATLHAAGCELNATLRWSATLLKKREELLNSIYYPWSYTQQSLSNHNHFLTHQILCDVPFKLYFIYCSCN
jgi:hypothetical protein